MPSQKAFFREEARLSQITVYIQNTLTGQKAPLETVTPHTVKMYACGVTTYDHCHIGHAMQAIYFDVIRRYLEYAGYQVIYVRNFTDVDDKIIQRAKERGMSPRVLADEMIHSTERDMLAVGVRPATHQPKVSESIGEIIQMIEDLIKNGSAYATEAGDVFYRVRKKADYGKLSNRDPDQLRSGTREVLSDGKEDLLDFALWKQDDVLEASWDSPWGRGRPGWHIECSAMAKKFLGNEIDIHGGGLDLIFPHHENEIAQSESANGCCYSRVWMHSGLLTINKQKMSKSLGNHLSIRDFLTRWPGEVLRFSFLQNHYRSHVDFNEAVFLRSAKRLFQYYQTIAQLEELAMKASAKPKSLQAFSPSPEEIKSTFHSHMSQDFLTPRALSELLTVMKEVQELTQKKKPTEADFWQAKDLLAVLKEVFGVLGLLQETPEEFLADLKIKMLASLKIDEQEIQEAIKERNEARKQKDFKKADAVRDQFIAKGIEFMDRPDGTDWTFRFQEIGDEK